MEIQVRCADARAMLQPLRQRRCVISTLCHRSLLLLQEKDYPDLDAPRILLHLIDAVRCRRGFQTEGIFRISHQKDELDALRKSFDAGI